MFTRETLYPWQYTHVYYDLSSRDKIFFWINSLRLSSKITFSGRNTTPILNYSTYHISNWFTCSVARGDWTHDPIRAKTGHVKLFSVIFIYIRCNLLESNSKSKKCVLVSTKQELNKISVSSNLSHCVNRSSICIKIMIHVNIQHFWSFSCSVTNEIILILCLKICWITPKKIGIALQTKLFFTGNSLIAVLKLLSWCQLFCILITSSWN